MPAVSKKQQQLFGIVHAFQQGKIPADKVSPQIKKIAKSISPEDAKKYASTTHADIKEVLQKIINSPKYIQTVLEEIVSTKTPQAIKGVSVDAFTSRMLLTVLTRLNETNKNKFLQYPINEMVAVAYKVVSY